MEMFDRHASLRAARVAEDRAAVVIEEDMEHGSPFRGGVWRNRQVGIWWRFFITSGLFAIYTVRDDIFGSDARLPGASVGA